MSVNASSFVRVAAGLEFPVMALARVASLVLLLTLAPRASIGASRLAVTGRAVDPEGAPIAKAEVSLQPIVSFHERSLELLGGQVAPKALATVRTSPDGGYRLGVPTPGMWQVKVSAPGKVPMRCRLIPLVESRKLADAVLEPDAGFEVRIEGERGNPIAGAQVWLRGPPSREPPAACSEFSRWHDADRYGVTGESGRVRLARRSGETIRVHAFAAGYLPAESDEVRSGSASLRLRPGTDVTLHVRSASGDPVSGAILLAFPQNWVAAVTGANGRARVTLPLDRTATTTLRLASGQIESRAISLLDETVGVDLEKGEMALEWRLPEPTDSVGSVVDLANGKPVPGALVWSSRDPGAFRVADWRGRFRQTLDSGEAGQIFATAPGYSTAWHTPARGPDGLRLPTLALSRTASLAGRVVDPEGRMIGGAVVRVTGEQFPTVFSESDGSFVLTGLEIGRSYELATGASGFAPDYRRLTFEPGRPLEILLVHGRSLFGRLLTPDGEPVAAARVVVVPIVTDPRLRSFSTQTERLPQTESDFEGRFRFDDLPREPSALVARREGLQDAIVRDLELTDGDEARDLGDLEMDWGVTLQGVVRARSGEPIPSVELTLHPENSDRIFMELLAEDARGRTTTTDGNGEFAFAGLAPSAELGISTRHPDYVDAILSELEPKAQEPLEIVLDQGATLSGRVLDDAGAPVEGLNLRIATAAPEGPAFETSVALPQAKYGVSGPEGWFEIGSVAPGRAELSVTSLAGWVVPEPLVLTLAAGEERSDLVVRVSAGATLAGTVSGPANRPVAGAWISVNSQPSFPPQARPVGRTRTTGGRSGAEGRFLIQGIPPESHHAEVTIGHPDFATLRQFIEIHPTGNRADFRLERGAAIGVWVRTESGEAVAQAQVTITAIEAQAYTSWSGGETDSTGSLEIKALTPGVYEVVARKRGFAESSKQRVEVTNGAAHQITLQLRAGGTIRGRLLGLEPDEIAGVEISASTESENDSGFAAGFVGNDGDYMIPDVGFSEGRVRATSPTRGQSVSEPFELDSSAGEARIDLDFGTGFSLSGVVLLNGEPLPRAEVLVRYDDRGFGRSSTGADGRFRLEGLTVGIHRIRVSPRNALDHEEDVQIAGDTDITIDIQGVRVSGRVVAEPDGTPVPGARVLVSAEHDVLAPFGDAETTAAASGAFEFRLPANRRVVLRALAAGHAETTVELKTGAGADISGVELVLGRAHELELDISLWSGLRPDRVTVALADASGARVMADALNALTPGSFRMTSAPEGNWTLLVASDSSAVVEQAVSIPGPPVAIVLPQGALVRVESRHGDAPNREVLRIVSPTGRALRLPVSLHRLSDFQFFGQAHVPWVPPGTWIVELIDSSGAVRRRTVSTIAGQTARVTFD